MAEDCGGWVRVARLVGCSSVTCASLSPVTGVDGVQMPGLADF